MLEQPHSVRPRRTSPWTSSITWSRSSTPPPGQALGCRRLVRRRSVRQHAEPSEPQGLLDLRRLLGLSSPTYLDDNEAQTIQTLYGGSKDDYEAHNPIHLLTDGQKYPTLAGWFSAGSSDTPSVQASQQLADAAKHAGFRQVCLTIPPGTHSFQFWSEAFEDSLPWISWQIGLTPKPASVRARCDPPIG